MIHVLKCRPNYFDDVQSGQKQFEVRKDDRGFQVDDELILIKWNSDFGYMREWFSVKITYILRGGLLPGDVVVLQVVPVGVENRHIDAILDYRARNGVEA